MDHLHIRTAQPGDTDAIRDILAAAYAPFVGKLDGLPDVTEFSRSDLKDQTVWIAEIGGHAAGVAAARFEGSVAHLANVAVHPQAGGRGIGRALIDTVVSAAREQGCTRLDLATHADMGSNVALYSRLGWSIVEAAGMKVIMSRNL